MFEKYKIINVNNSIYLLENSKGQKYEKAIIFYEVEPKDGDILYMPQSIIKESTIFNYGPIGSEYSKEDINENEFIKLYRNGESIYLQRYYG